MNKINCLILAAGKHKNNDTACSLWTFSNGKSILDWQYHTLKLAIENPSIQVAVGFRYEEVVKKYKNLNFCHIENWKKLNSLGSFLEADFALSDSLLVMYGDTVFRYESIRELTRVNEDIVIGVDSKWESRFANRSFDDIEIAEKIETPSNKTFEYTGLIKLSPKVLKFIKENKTHLKNKSFLDLIGLLKNSGFNMEFFDLYGDWAEMNEANDLVKFILGTKAETLNRIKSIVKKSEVCEQYLVISRQWKLNREVEIKNIEKKFNSQNVIIRSSSSDEDNWKTANAGLFLSLMNIEVKDQIKLAESIDSVFDSYEQINDDSQVLIQPFINDVILSGVIFTRDLVTGSPYYVINYDDESGSTSSVTSGKDGNFRKLVISHKGKNIIKNIDDRLTRVIDAAQELETIFGFDKLDIEFAIDKNNKLYSFQVRPISVNHDSRIHKSDEDIFNLISKAKEKFMHLQNNNKNLGRYTIFSNMTDWNPAEIIGTHPNTLAYSLYEHIITNDVWALQRKESGYRDLVSTPLMVNFSGQPYIDCRASINSFIPKNLPNSTAERLINAYLEILKKKPHLHDKLELEVVFTIWEPNFLKIANERFKNYDVSYNDIKILEKELKLITIGAFNRLDEDLKPLEELKKFTEEIIASDSQSIEKAHSLIELVKKFGTLSFSHAARAGFVAITLLKSFVNCGILSKDRLLEFQTSIKTVAGEFTEDLGNQDINVDQLIKKYGHLRPGTYDISEKAYWENKQFYFRRPNTAIKNTNSRLNKKFNFSEVELLKMQKSLHELSSEIDIKEIIKYFVKAITSRELSKFVFSRSLSLALDELVKFFTNNSNIKRSEIGYLNWNNICDLNLRKITLADLHSELNYRKKKSHKKSMVKLPSVIFSVDSFYGFEEEKSSPNFITHKKITAEVIEVIEDEQIDYFDKIVMIPSADPGYDWLFAHKIAGLVTTYGGANSHMAIRCAELDLPAAIGVGEELYNSLKNMRQIFLDCYNEKISNV